MRPGPVVQQLSVFIANEAGRISEVTGALGDSGINIRGFSVSDTVGYGILRLITDSPGEAQSLLTDHGFTTRMDDVICIDLPDRPGGLAQVLRVVAEAGVNIEYIYSLVSTFVVINVTDVDRALTLLSDAPVELASLADVATPLKHGPTT